MHISYEEKTPRFVSVFGQCPVWKMFINQINNHIHKRNISFQHKIIYKNELKTEHEYRKKLKQLSVLQLNNTVKVLVIVSLKTEHKRSKNLKQL